MDIIALDLMARSGAAPQKALGKNDGRQVENIVHGKYPQGRIELQGFYDTAGALFAGQAAVQQLNPARLHTSLDAAPLQGTLSAKADATQKVAFEADLKAAGPAPRAGSKALRIQTLAAKGE